MPRPMWRAEPSISALPASRVSADFLSRTFFWGTRTTSATSKITSLRKLWSPHLPLGKQAYRAFYFNDTWHAVDRLTINLGLRYELQSPWTERYNRLSYFDPRCAQLHQSISSARLSAVMGDVFLVPDGTRSSSPCQQKDFAPRIGVAYSLTLEDSGSRWLRNLLDSGRRFVRAESHQRHGQCARNYLHGDRRRNSSL